MFLDRDGTINEQVGYVNHLDRFYLLDRAAEAIRRLNSCGIPVIVVSNQAGAARGYFPPSLIDEVNDKMHRLLAREGARLDGLYYCPHLPGACLPELDKHCDCRKPAPGMLLRAARDHDIDLAGSYMVGDRMSDVAFGQGVGAKGILVLTGYGKGEADFVEGVTADHIAPDLAAAVEWILADLEQPGRAAVESSGGAGTCTERS